MTMTTHDRPLSAASDAYLAAVGAALAGVPDSDRQELLDDLAEHLSELADESDAGLVERLGQPDHYAAELLASAGIEPAARSASRRSQLVERFRATAARFDSTSTQKLQAFLVELRPGWWVARGWLVVAAIAARRGLQEALWLPNVTHNDLQNLVLLAGAIALSVWVARGPKWAAWLATAIGLLALFSLGTADRSYFYPVYDSPVYDNPGVLTAPSGKQVTNLFAYDASGEPVRVFVFDQDGVPLDVGNAVELQNSGVPFISGWFPQPRMVWDHAGRARGQQPKPPIVSVPQLPQPAKAAAPAKTTTITPKPTGATGGSP